MNLFSFLENTRKTAQAKDFSPSISRLRKKKRREKRKERENIVLYFRLGKETEKKKKRRKGREEGKRKNGKSGADWLLSGGPIADRAEQR